MQIADLDPADEPVLHALATLLLEGFREITPTAWPDLEVKPLTAAFHYRTAPDRDAARITLEHVATRAIG